MIFNHKNIIWTLILILIDSPLLFASTLELSNGDRITGKLIKEENDTLFFNSDILGQISVKTSQGKVTDTTIQLEPNSKNEVAKSDKKSTPMKKSKWAILSTMLEDTPPGKKLDSSIMAGYRVGDGERNQSDLNLAFNVRHESGKNQYFIDGRYDYSVQKIGDESIANRDRYNVGFRWRRDLSDRIFTQSDSSYLKDLIKQIDDEFKQSFGLGWRIYNKDKFEFSVTPAFSVRYENIATITNQWGVLGSLFQDVRYKIRDNITFFQESDISFNPDSDSALNLQFLTRLEAQISNRMVANLRYEIDFDDNLPVGVDKTQERLIFGLGYKF